MGTMRGTWLALALVLVALQAGCGRTDGASADSDGDGTVDAEDCAATFAERWQNLDGFRDDDGDGLGAGPATSLCSGEALPPGWVQEAGDCDDGDATRWRQVPGLYPDRDGDGATARGPVVGCVGNTLDGYRVQPGTPDCDDAEARFQRSTTGWLDSDGDGVGDGPTVSYCQGALPPPGYAARNGDCAPDDAHRSAPLHYRFRDADLDGHTVPMQGTLCASRLPPDYLNLESGLDCDDADATRWVLRSIYLDTDGDGFGVGETVTRCSGATPDPGYAWDDEDCAPEDRSRWQWRSYEHRDRDGDGATLPERGVLCTTGELPGGYHDWANGHDCDDANRDVRVSWSLFPDTDGDGVGAGSLATLCAGPQRPEGYAFTGTDCEATNATVWQALAYSHRDGDGDGHTVAQAGTLCAGAALPPGYRTQGHGNDCDDAAFTVHTALQAWADTDADGVGAGEATTLCTDGTVPAPWSATGTDCEPEDRDHWRRLSYFHVDRDADGHTLPERGQVCTGATLHAPYFTQATGNDCNDAQAAVFRWAVLYPDADGDGVGAPPREVSCLGQGVPMGMSIKGYDVNDLDAAVQEDPDEDLLVELILAP
jgi:hypothetical protein